jgi:hypothetical protein
LNPGKGKSFFSFLISGFRRDVDKICALLEYYAALSGNPVPTFRANLSVPSARIKNSEKKNMGRIVCPESLVQDYNSTPRNILEEH